jgi:hypothetical protein
VAIAGIQPKSPFPGQLGLTLEGTMTSLDLEDGIAMLKAADKEGGTEIMDVELITVASDAG